MKQVQCPNCGKLINVEEIKKGIEVTCECSCKQKCIDENEYISRWRSIETF